MVVLCVHECADVRSGRAGQAWQQVMELARGGHDVWVVTSSPTLLVQVKAPNLHVVLWDLPPLSAWLKGHWARGLRRALWYWHVDHAIDDWHAAIGMHTVRRVVGKFGSGTIYFAAKRRRADRAKEVR